MTLSMLAIIIKAKVCVICRSRRLRRITQTEALIIIANMQKPNSYYAYSRAELRHDKTDQTAG